MHIQEHQYAVAAVAQAGERHQHTEEPRQKARAEDQIAIQQADAAEEQEADVEIGIVDVDGQRRLCLKLVGSHALQRVPSRRYGESRDIAQPRETLYDERYHIEQHRQ